jgi:hypothetical protein
MSLSAFDRPTDLELWRTLKSYRCWWRFAIDRGNRLALAPGEEQSTAKPKRAPQLLFLEPAQLQDRFVE